MPSSLPKANDSGEPQPSLFRLSYFLKVLAAAGIFACLFYFSDTAALGTALHGANKLSIAAGSAIFLFGQYLAALRWRGVLKAGDVVVSRLEALRLNWVGAFVGNFLPGQGSGDLVKSAFLFGRFPKQRTFLFASVVYDRLLGLSAMLALALVGLFMLGLMSGDWSLANIAGLVLLLVAAAVPGVIYVYRVRPLRRFVSDHLRKRVANFSEQLVGLLCNRPLCLRSFSLSMAYQLSWALSVWTMLRAIQPSTPLIPVLLAAPVAVLVASVPVSLGGLGVREGAFSLLMQRFGVSADIATAGALLSLIPLLIASSVGALMTLWMRKRQGRCHSSV